MAAVLFSALLAGAQKQWHWKHIRSMTEQNQMVSHNFLSNSSKLHFNKRECHHNGHSHKNSEYFFLKQALPERFAYSYLRAWVLCAHLSLLLEQVQLVWDTWELQGKVNFIQNSLHMIFKPPLYLLSCSCTSQIHASSSFNHTHTCLCLFIKCWLHGLGRAKQLRLDNFRLTPASEVWVWSSKCGVSWVLTVQ